MRTRWIFLLPLLVAMPFVSGCDFVGDVIEFGFWTGVVFVAVVLLVVWFVVRAFRR